MFSSSKIAYEAKGRFLLTACGLASWFRGVMARLSSASSETNYKPL
jgi:hypothetical protein